MTTEIKDSMTKSGEEQRIPGMSEEEQRIPLHRRIPWNPRLDQPETRICRHHNKGHCKRNKAGLKTNIKNILPCSFLHPKENCPAWDGTPGSCKDPDDLLFHDEYHHFRHPKICPFNTIGRCVFKNKCVLLHKDPSGQMTAVDKLLKAMKQEVSELKEEVKVLKQEKGDTMKTVKKDVLQVEGKEEQRSLAEETNRLRERLAETELQTLDAEMRAKSNSQRLDILASTQDIFNKNQTEELKNLRRMLTEKTLDTNTEPNSTMTEQKMNYLTTQLNNLAERQDQIRSDWCSYGNVQFYYKTQQSCRKANNSHHLLRRQQEERITHG